MSGFRQPDICVTCNKDKSEWPIDHEYTLLCEKERHIKLGEKSYCRADKDGDCIWTSCPQIEDKEPITSGRHCPLDLEDAEQ